MALGRRKSSRPRSLGDSSVGLGRHLDVAAEAKPGDITSPGRFQAGEVGTERPFERPGESFTRHAGVSRVRVAEQVKKGEPLLRMTFPEIEHQPPGASVQILSVAMAEAVVADQEIEIRG